MICDVHQRYTLSVQFQRLLADAGIQGKSYHCLRHTLATELNAEGESIEAIAKALGHGSTRATKGYLH
jgi:site-specific recombinase XerD